MSRKLLSLAFLLACPAAAGAAQVHGDFNGDGIADLAIGVPNEDVGTIADAGAVNVLYGTATGLSSATNQIWTQNSLGIVGDVSEDFDLFGFALAAGDFNGDGFDDLAVGVVGEDVAVFMGTVANAGAINVLYGSANGLQSDCAIVLAPGQQCSNHPDQRYGRDGRRDSGLRGRGRFQRRHVRRPRSRRARRERRRHAQCGRSQYHLRHAGRPARRPLRAAYSSISASEQRRDRRDRRRRGRLRVLTGRGGFRQDHSRRSSYRGPRRVGRGTHRCRSRAVLYGSDNGITPAAASFGRRTARGLPIRRSSSMVSDRYWPPPISATARRPISRSVVPSRTSAP